MFVARAEQLLDPLGAPLRNVYEAGSVVVSANTVPALQGETVYQVLGSGDGGVTWNIPNLSAPTNPSGTYVLTVNASGSGIADLACPNCGLSFQELHRAHSHLPFWYRTSPEFPWQDLYTISWVRAND